MNNIAPTYVANAVTFIAIVLAYFKISVAPADLQVTITTLLIIGTPLFSMARQIWTGRSTFFGARP